VIGVVDQAAAAELLELIDERDMWLALRHDAYREGYMAGAQDQWAAGYVAAIADVKRTQHQTVKQLAPGGAAWLDTVKRNGGTEYGGAGKPRVPVDIVAIELAEMMMRGRVA
jgi:hypothetical protein